MYYEIYKVLFSYKIIWLIMAFLLIKTAVVCILPELRDPRIKISKNQYDKVLEEVAGETSPKKEQYIFETNEHYLSTLNKYQDNLNLYLAGKIDEDVWKDYTNEYNEAKLYGNAFSMLNEKAEAFVSFRTSYDSDLPLQAYFYEYGWHSVFIYMSFPDPILCIFALIIGIQFICPEISSGSMQVILTSKKGRRSLFITKLISLFILLGSTAIINIIIELVVFYSRFYLKEGHWPLYSITLFISNPIKLNLYQALALIMVIRHMGFIFTGLFAFCIAGLTENASHGMFISILLILLPWLLIPDIPFTISAWLSGTPVLKVSYRITPLIVLIVTLIITTWIFYYKKFLLRKIIIHKN